MVECMNVIGTGQWYITFKSYFQYVLMHGLCLWHSYLLLVYDLIQVHFVGKFVSFEPTAIT